MLIKRLLLPMDMQWRLIDAIGPFFLEPKGRVNWSKVPFSVIEKSGRLPKERADKIVKRFGVFAKKVAQEGFNAITIDDVAHMVIFDWYPSGLKEKLADYAKLYERLIAIAKKQDLRVLATTDVMFLNKCIYKKTGRSFEKMCDVFRDACELLYQTYDVAGVVLRIGEADGDDVKGDFKSRLVIKTPKQARELLTALLPVCEKYNKFCFFRTWTLGAFKVGDLSWNVKTFRKVFDGIRSDNLIISMKYGNADFFRFLKLNPLFFVGNHKRIVELQARREYEGAGRFPSFVGFEYEKYRDELKACKSLVGFSVWCQTGGWSRAKDVTFVENSSVWNELNTFVSIKLFTEKGSASMLARRFYAQKFKRDDKRFIEFLKVSDDVINSIWYVSDFAKQQFFFRRVRVPPLLWVFWDAVLLTPFSQTLLTVNMNGEKMVREAHSGLAKLSKMQVLGESLQLPSLQFQCDTFLVLVKCREVLCGKTKVEELRKAIVEYQQKYPDGYSFVVSKFALARIARVFVRSRFKRKFMVESVASLAGRLFWRSPLEGIGMSSSVILR